MLVYSAFTSIVARMQSTGRGVCSMRDMMCVVSLM